MGTEKGTGFLCAASPKFKETGDASGKGTPLRSQPGQGSGMAGRTSKLALETAKAPGQRVKAVSFSLLEFQKVLGRLGSQSLSGILVPHPAQPALTRSKWLFSASFWSLVS